MSNPEADRPDALTSFFIALQLMTRLPLGDRVRWSEAGMSASVAWYPAVGVVIGAIGALSLWALSLVMPMPVAVLFAVFAVVTLTGALHEDGLADSVDALGGHAPRDRALEIMRDSSIGTYGVLALIFVLSAKVMLLGHLGTVAIWALLAAHVISRAAIVWIIDGSTYARQDGKAEHVDGSGRFLSLPSLVALALGCAPLLVIGGALAAVAGILGAALVAAIWQSHVKKRIGGYTGDTLGAAQQLSEIGVYLGILIAL